MDYTEKKTLNLTVHDICLYNQSDVLQDKTFFTPKEGAIPCMIFTPSGIEARAVAKETYVSQDCVGFDNEGKPILVDVVKMKYSDPINLPDYDPNTILLVSAITANAALAAYKKAGKYGLPARPVDDLRIVAGMVRDSSGKIIGCTKFSKVCL